MSSLCRKYTNSEERRMQGRLTDIRKAIQRCDKCRKHWEIRQELQRKAMFLMSEFPKYKPIKQWWL